MLADTIRQLRKEHHLSQSELARRSGHPISSIHGIENGDNQNPRFRMMRDIASVLGVSLDELAKSL